MNYVPGIARRKSIRLKGYDYSQPGVYFVTICTYRMKHLFGKIKNKKMILNDLGKIVRTCWLAIPDHFPNVTLDEFIIMPNHLHGIIIISPPANPMPSPGQANDDSSQAAYIFSHRNPSTDAPAPFRSPSKTLGSIIRGFKIGVRANYYSPVPANYYSPKNDDSPMNHDSPKKDDSPMNHDSTQKTKTPPIWHRNYYDRIITTQSALNCVRRYIIKNPANFRPYKGHRNTR